jgi:hypothetical protein
VRLGPDRSDPYSDRNTLEIDDGPDEHEGAVPATPDSALLIVDDQLANQSAHPGWESARMRRRTHARL